MIRAFVSEGATVDVITLRPGKGRDSLDSAVNVHVAHRGTFRRRWNRRYRYRATPLWATGVEALLAQRDFLKSARHLSKSGQRHDLIYARHTWLPYSLPRIKSRMKAPLFLEVNALFAKEKAEREELAFSSMTHRLEKWTLGSADHVLPVSEALADQIEGLGVSSNRIRVTPNGVDFDLFNPQLKSKIAGRDNHPFSIGLASSFRHYHGIKTL